MENLEKCIQVAKEAGCPKDQVSAFLNSGYIPLKWQWDFHSAAREADKDNGPVDIGVGGARGPGKSHAVLSQAALDDCQRVPQLKGLFLRQTGISAKESFDDLIDKAIRGHVTYEKVNNVLRFPNGSRIILGGFKDNRDIDKYVGIEYDFIIVEELTQLTEDKYVKLRGSLRTSKEGWRPRMYTSFNPGGIGHQFVKERYILPFREAIEKETRFIGANYKSNPYLNVEYVEYLEGLSGDLGKAWREGEWDLFAGQYFSEWRFDIHTCEPFEIPNHWKRFVMGDYGYTKPSAVYWGAVSEDGQLFIYRELYKTELTFENLTKEIVSMTNPSEDISFWVFDPAIWSRGNEKEGEPVKISGAEIMLLKYQELTHVGLQLIRGNNDRIIGWGTVREYLKKYSKGESVTAKLQVFRTCHELIRTLPSLVYDDYRVEDLNTDGEDHAADALRYGIMSRPPVTTKPLNQIDILLNKSSYGKERGEYDF